MQKKLRMKKVAVVCGGYSKEEIVSLKSAEQISQSIDQNLFEIYKVFINKEKWEVLLSGKNISINKNDFSFELGGSIVKFDAVFMAIHGTPGEDGMLQSYFEMLNIPVTTCNTFVSALTFNKNACKIHLKNYGILTANSICLKSNNALNPDRILKELNLPMFVKPNNGGSSFGITKVKLADEIIPAIEKAFNEDTEVIIEEFIEGREFTCGVFKSANNNIVLPITEIISETEFFDYEAKYEGKSNEVTPAQLTDDLTKQCQDLTSEIYDVLGCTGVVRIDFLLKNNQFYFMEVNTVPGMSAESVIPQQVRAHGLTVTNFYTLLINDAIDRNVL